MLKVGDRIRIVKLPFKLPLDAVEAYNVLIARKRPVRICELDNDGRPRYSWRVKLPDGTWEHHWDTIFSEDDHWVPVKKRPEVGSELKSGSRVERPGVKL